MRGIDSHLKGLSEFTDEETPEESESLDDAPVLVELYDGKSLLLHLCIGRLR